MICESNTAKARREPQRTCVGCRRRADKGELSRLIYDPEAKTIVWDRHRRLPGRGVWVHPRGTCLPRALHLPVLARALRLDPQTPVAVDFHHLAAQMQVSEAATPAHKACAADELMEAGWKLMGTR